MNRQRVVIYGERDKVLDGHDVREQLRDFACETLAAYIEGATAEGYPEDWDLPALWTALHTLYPISLSIDDVISLAGGDVTNLDAEFLLSTLQIDVLKAYDHREESLGSEVMRELERRVVLSVLDRKWREHLYEMDYLQEGIGLRAMAQRDPLVEYQREGYDLFMAMMESIKEEAIGFLFNVEVTVETPEQTHEHVELSAKGLAEHVPTQLVYSAPDEAGAAHVSVSEAAHDSVGRNELCPCGSGKKFKRCHGQPGI